jgi:hypothetical protein
MAVATFHIKKGQIRTTVSLERVLMELLSIHLVGKAEFSAVTKWAQQQVDDDPGAYEKATSQRLASKAALEIAPKKLQEQYWDLALAESQKARRKGKRRA